MPVIVDAVRRRMSRVVPTLTDEQRKRDMAAYLLTFDDLYPVTTEQREMARQMVREHARHDQRLYDWIREVDAAAGKAASHGV